MKKRTQNIIAAILFVTLVIIGLKYTGLPGSGKMICTKNLTSKNIEFNVLLGSKNLKYQTQKKFQHEQIDYSSISFDLLIGDLPKKGNEGSYIYFLTGSPVRTQANQNESNIHHLVLITRGAKSVPKFVVVIYFLILLAIPIWFVRNIKLAHNRC